MSTGISSMKGSLSQVRSIQYRMVINPYKNQPSNDDKNHPILDDIESVQESDDKKHPILDDNLRIIHKN